MTPTNHRWDAASVDLVAAKETYFGTVIDDDDEAYVRLRPLRDGYESSAETENIELDYLRTDFMPSSVLPGTRTVTLKLAVTLRSGGTRLAVGDEARPPADLLHLLEACPVTVQAGRAGSVTSGTATGVGMADAANRVKPGMLLWLRDASTHTYKPVWAYSVYGDMIRFAGTDTWNGESAWRMATVEVGSVLLPTWMLTPGMGFAESLCMEAVTALSHADGRLVSETLCGLGGAFSIEETETGELLALSFAFKGNSMHVEEQTQARISRLQAAAWPAKPAPLSMLGASLRINGQETAYASLSFKPEPPVVESLNAGVSGGRDGWALADGAWKNEVEIMVFSEDSETLPWTELARTKGEVDLSWICGDEDNGVGLHCPRLQVREAVKKDIGGLRAYRIKGVALKPNDDDPMAWSLCFSGKSA